MWEKARREPRPGTNPSVYQSSAEKALGLLRGFRKVFPIGQAYAHYYQGWYDELTDKPELAARSWHTGLAAAQKFGLLYEEGLIRARLGNTLRDAPDECREHMERAVQIFTQMGAAHELRMAGRVGYPEGAA
jgi:hypothetical protein